MYSCIVLYCINTLLCMTTLRFALVTKCDRKDISSQLCNKSPVYPKTKLCLVKYNHSALFCACTSQGQFNGPAGVPLITGHRLINSIVSVFLLAHTLNNFADPVDTFSGCHESQYRSCQNLPRNPQ